MPVTRADWTIENKTLIVLTLHCQFRIYKPERLARVVHLKDSHFQGESTTGCKRLFRGAGLLKERKRLL